MSEILHDRRFASFQITDNILFDSPTILHAVLFFHYDQLSNIWVCCVLGLKSRFHVRLGKVHEASRFAGLLNYSLFWSCKRQAKKTYASPLSLDKTTSMLLLKHFKKLLACLVVSWKKKSTIKISVFCVAQLLKWGREIFPENLFNCMLFFRTGKRRVSKVINWTF